MSKLKDVYFVLRTNTNDNLKILFELDRIRDFGTIEAPELDNIKFRSNFIRSDTDLFLAAKVDPTKIQAVSRLFLIYYITGNSDYLLSYFEGYKLDYIFSLLDTVYNLHLSDEIMSYIISRMTRESFNLTKTPMLFVKKYLYELIILGKEEKAIKVLETFPSIINIDTYKRFDDILTGTIQYTRRKILDYLVSYYKKHMNEDILYDYVFRKMTNISDIDVDSLDMVFDVIGVPSVDIVGVAWLSALITTERPSQKRVAMRLYNLYPEVNWERLRIWPIIRNLLDQV